MVLSIKQPSKPIYRISPSNSISITIDIGSNYLDLLSLNFEIHPSKSTPPTTFTHDPLIDYIPLHEGSIVDGVYTGIIPPDYSYGNYKLILKCKDMVDLETPLPKIDVYISIEDGGSDVLYISASDLE